MDEMGSSNKKRRGGFLSRLARRAGAADKLTALLAVAVIAVSTITAVPAIGLGGTQMDSNLGGSELSISSFSEIMANAFNSTMSQALPHQGMARKYLMKVDAEDNGLVDVGTIGNFLGYPGGNDDAEDAANVWTKGVDASSKVMTLESVLGFYGKQAGGGNYTRSSMMKYILWGSALNSMGIDEFRDAQSASDGIRMVTGYAAYILFILAYSAANIMRTVTSLMKQLNVFRVFTNLGTGAINHIATSMLGTDTQLMQNVKKAVDMIAGWKYIILAFMLTFLVFSTYVYKGKGYNNAGTLQDRWRKFFYRIAIIAIGIPVCGIVYTELVDIINASAVSSTYNITNYVFQEFLDFEAWTTKGMPYSFRVGDGSGGGMSELHVVYDAGTQTFTIEANNEAVDATKLVYTINAGLYGTDVTGDPTDDDHYVKNLYTPTGAGATGSTTTYSGLLSKDPPIAPKEAYARCRDLLLNYARSNTVMPDTLNDMYLYDLVDLSEALFAIRSGDKGSQDAVANQTAVEQLFGVNSANQRIWSYVQLGGSSDSWIYPHDGTDREVILSEVDGRQLKATLKGVVAVSGRDNSNGVYLEGGATSRMIMGGTLNNAQKVGTYATEKVEVRNYTIGTSSASVTLNDDKSSYVYDYTFDLSDGGMSTLALYNYMHSKFENGTLTVYDPDSTTNAGVGMMHYSVTTPYSGIPEMVQLLFTVCMLFSVGIIGWVFGISLLMNTVVQALKAVPTIFKMMLGSMQGFVEGLLIALSICAELMVTVWLYSWALDIIDFLIKAIQKVVWVILGAFTDVFGTVDIGEATGGVAGSSIDPESYAIMSGIISMLAILWGTFNLIKWRRAITISIKSLLTHVLNQVFGTSAQMPTGASSGAMKAVGGLAAGAMVAGALADQGTLDDVVNDLTDSDLGSSIHDKLAEGDYEGAMKDISDYASGNYTGSEDRGRSETADAQRALAEADDSVGGALSASGQSLTDEQQQQLGEEFDDEIQAADQKLQDAEENGTEEEQQEARDELNGVLMRRAERAAGMRSENARKAEQIGVADYGDYLRNQKDGVGTEAEGFEGADLPDKPQRDGQDAELDANGQMAYDAANDGDAQTLRTASRMYDERGLTAAQKAEIDEMVLDGATEQQVADKIDDFARDNFGDDYDKVVDKMNEAAGRSNTATYGDNNPTDGRPARTMSAQGIATEDGGIQYGMTDNSDGEQKLMDLTTGEAREVQGGTFLPEASGVELDETSAGIYQAVAQGDHTKMLAAAGTVSALGTYAHQDRILQQMAANGASATEIATAANNFAQDNFGDNYAQVVSQINQAAGRTSERVTLSGTGADGTQRSVDISMATDAGGQVSYNVHGPGGQPQTIDVQEGGAGGNVTYVNRGAGEKIVTQDFGKTDGVSGTTYGETYGRMMNVANASGGMIQVGTPQGVSGGGAAVMTTSEMTAAAMAQQAMNVGGTATVDVKLGNVQGAGGVQQHLGQFQQVVETHTDAMGAGNWGDVGGSQGQAAMIRRTEQVINQTINGGSEGGDAPSGGGDEFFDPTSEDSGVIFDPDDYQGGGTVHDEGRNGGE